MYSQCDQVNQVVEGHIWYTYKVVRLVRLWKAVSGMTVMALPDSFSSLRSARLVKGFSCRNRKLLFCSSLQASAQEPSTFYGLQSQESHSCRQSSFTACYEQYVTLLWYILTNSNCFDMMDIVLECLLFSVIHLKVTF